MKRPFVVPASAGLERRALFESPLPVGEGKPSSGGRVRGFGMSGGRSSLAHRPVDLIGTGTRNKDLHQMNWLQPPLRALAYYPGYPTYFTAGE